MIPSDLFRRIATKTSQAVGKPLTFALATLIVLIWFAIGPFYHFSTDYQIIINTGTTIITFLLVFLIQNTQNRDSHALHLKLDELIRVNKLARNNMINLDVFTDAEIKKLQLEFEKLAEK